ncbi:MAG: purine-binding chemotaxis protein CheW, partial [Candidatus Tectomicrobia bacterium]|nr:purine-binding chemotaxis protein CheW [Candidatus Tectomicrobia bacterium]
LRPAAVTLDALVGSIDRDVHQVYSQGLVPQSPSRRLDSQNQTERYILFTLGESRYAVPVPHVVEIGRIPRITPVPNVPSWVRGVINLRGEILSVLDFRTFLGMEDMHHDEHSRMLVVKTPGDEVATSLIVDQIMGIVPLTTARLEIPATSNNKAAPYLTGAYEHEDQVCAVFDLERLLLSPEVRQFE